MSTRTNTNADEVYKLLAKDHPTPEEFKVLLAHVSAGVLAKRYLATGLPFVFDGQPHKYLAFRESLGRIFDVPPQDISVMGSARFGFSTSPHKQQGSAKLLDKNSDMDLVVVSNRLFVIAVESFARSAFSTLRDVAGLTDEIASDTDTVEVNAVSLQQLRNRAKALNYGYVSPTDLPDGSEEKQRFYDMQREAGTQLFGTAPPGPISRVGARLYRSWDAAERSFEFSFKQLAKELGIRNAIEDPTAATATSTAKK